MNYCNYHNNRRKANTVHNQTEVLLELVLETAPELISLEAPSISVDSHRRSLPKEVLVQEMPARKKYHLRAQVPAHASVCSDSSKLKATQQQKVIFFEPDTLIPDTAQVAPLDFPKNVAQMTESKQEKTLLFKAIRQNLVVRFNENND